MGKKEIIIAEDDNLIRQVLEEALTDLGHQVTATKDGEELLRAVDAALARGKPPDLITLDVNMPNISGLEAARRLAANKTTQDIPRFFITTSPEPDQLPELEKLSRKIIRKPFNLYTLDDELGQAA